MLTARSSNTGLCDSPFASRNAQTARVPDLTAGQQPADLVELLRLRARLQPAEPAYTFLMDGEQEAGTLSWEALDLRARALASRLLEHAAPGDRALLLHSASLDFVVGFFGCLYAGIVAVPAFPVRKGRHDARVASMAADSGATLALTHRSTLPDVEAMVASTPELAPLRWLATDDDLEDQGTTSSPGVLNALAARRAAQWKTPALAPTSLAYLQYTSGSTSAPKGVLVAHDNLLYNLADLDSVWAHDRESVMVSWLPVFHDMGLIYGLLMPLFRGFRCVFMAPEAFVGKPIRWLRAFTQFRGTHAAAPNFAYELCVRKTTPEQRAELDLSAWRMALNAAEPVVAETMDRFVRAFAPCGFRPTTFTPGYGLAEATLKVTAARAVDMPLVCHFSGAALEQHRVEPAMPGATGSRPLVGNGGVQLHTGVAIVDPDTRRRAAPNAVGEVWMSGPSRARGYWGLSEESRLTFEARILHHDGTLEDALYLRTGDLGFMWQGQLFITGRRKDLIIVRGSNHYPQDIETSAERSHPALRPGGGAAFALSTPGGDLVVVVHEVRPDAMAAVDPEDIFHAIRRAVTEQHELVVDAVVLAPPGGVPKTSSGKKQRSACRAAYQAGARGALAVWRSPRAAALHKQGEVKAAPAPARVDVTPQPPSPLLHSDPRVPELLTWLRQYAETRLQSRVVDERRTIPPYVVLDLGNRGLLGMMVPKEYGGLGLGHGDMLRIVEQLGAIDQSLALFVALNNVLGIYPLLRYGRHEDHTTLLPVLAAGRELTAFALTEPGAGSNPKAIDGRAEPTGDGRLRITATKWWSGVASWSTRIHVFVREVDAEGKPVGISAFTVPQGSPGLRQGPEALTMGMRGFIQNAIEFDGVEVDASHRLGEPGKGMEVAQDAMMLGRLAIAAMSAGGLKRCAQLMVRYASRRQVSTGLLLDNPITQERISHAVAGARLLDSLVSAIAGALDAGRTVPGEAYAVAKMAGPELFWTSADALVQLLGGRGYIESNGAPQLLRDARVLRIFEGPTETIAMHTGSLLWNRRPELPKFISEVLGEPSLASQLADECEAMRQMAEREADAAATLQRRRLAQSLVGEFACWFVLLAAARWSRDAQAIHFAEQRLQHLLAHARARLQSPVWLAASESLRAAVQDFAATVGDLDPLHVGDQQDFDPLLRRGEVPPGIPSSPPSPLLAPAEAEAILTSPAATVLTPASATATASSSAAAIASWIIRWFAAELQMPEADIEAGAPLAKLGLDSVSAVSLVAELEEWLAIPVSMDLPWSHPSIAEMAARLAADKDRDSEIHGAADITGTTRSTSNAPHHDESLWATLARDAELPADIHTGGLEPVRPGSPTAILLTGATGYVGAYLLHTLLTTSSAEIRCLVRAATQEEGQRRLERALSEHGLPATAFEGRVVPVLGDLAAPRLGLRSPQFAALAQHIDAIYHCGAQVNFAYPYATLRHANVGGTLEVLRLATTHRVKAVHAVSTFSLVGQHSADPRQDLHSASDLLSRPLYDEQALHRRFFDLGYVQSKWVADELLLAARSRGVPISVYRPASVCADSRTGQWSAADWICRVLLGCHLMGAAPTQDAVLAMVPVDWVANTIVALSQRQDSNGRGFNLSSAHPVPWDRLLDRLDAVRARLNPGSAPLARLAPAEWLQRASAEARTKDHPVAPLLGMLRRRPPEQLVLGFPPSARVPQLLATRSLEGTGLDCPPLSDSQLDAALAMLLGASSPSPFLHQSSAAAFDVSANAKPESALPAWRALFGGLSVEGAVHEASIREQLSAIMTPEQAEPRARILWAALQEKLLRRPPNHNTPIRSEEWENGWGRLADRIVRRGRAPRSLPSILAALFVCVDSAGCGTITEGGLRSWHRLIGAHTCERALEAFGLTLGGALGFDAFEDVFLQLVLAGPHSAGAQLLFPSVAPR